MEGRRTNSVKGGPSGVGGGGHSEAILGVKRTSFWTN